MRNETPVVLPNATAVSLDLPHYLPFDQWLAYLSYVKIIGQAWSWWLGDLLIAADAFGYTDEAIQAIDEMGIAPQTAANAKSVCSRMPKERRRTELAFSHHAIVCYLPEARAELLLSEAAANHWTVRRLREEACRGLARRDEQRLGRASCGKAGQGEELLTKVTTNGARLRCVCPTCGAEHQRKNDH